MTGRCGDANAETDGLIAKGNHPRQLQRIYYIFFHTLQYTAQKIMSRYPRKKRKMSSWKMLIKESVPGRIWSTPVKEIMMSRAYPARVVVINSSFGNFLWRPNLLFFIYIIFLRFFRTPKRAGQMLILFREIIRILPIL
jgi:hypothetical protein